MITIALPPRQRSRARLPVALQSVRGGSGISWRERPGGGVDTRQGPEPAVLRAGATAPIRRGLGSTESWPAGSERHRHPEPESSIRPDS